MAETLTRAGGSRKWLIRGLVVLVMTPALFLGLYAARHNSAPPPLQAAYLMGGSLIIEVIFSWPGIGLQLYTSVSARDLPVIMAITVVVAAVFTLINLIADLLQGVVDPRIRYS